MNKKSLLLLIPFAAAALAGCTPTVKPCDEAVINFKQASLTLGINEQKALPYEIEGGECSGELKFNVADPSVAKVDLVDGVYKVTGLKEGTTEITCNGKTFTVYVQKEAPDPTKEVVEVLSVKSAPSQVAVGGTIDPNSVILNVKLSDGTGSTVKATKVDCVTSAAAESVEATAWYREVGSAKFNIKVVAEAPSSMKEAYEAALALPEDEEQTKEFNFSGVVVGIRSATNEYFIQDGSYGIDIYNPSDKSLFALGKKVNVSSTLQNFNGVVETKTISKIEAAGDGVIPEAAVVNSKATLDSLKTSVHAKVTGTVKADPEFTAGKDFTLKLDVNGDEIPVFFKGKSNTPYKDFIESLKAGDEVTADKAVIAAYKGNQICIVDDTELTKGEEPGPVTPSLKLDKLTASVKVGADITITATAKNTENPIQWSLVGDSGSLVTMTENGNFVTIHGVAKGTAKVKAAIPADNLEAVCEITVKDADPVGDFIDVNIEDAAKANNLPTGNDHEPVETWSYEGVTSTVTGTKVGTATMLNSGKVYITSDVYNLRLYQNENPSWTLSVADGKISKVIVTYTVNNTGVLLHGTTQVTSETPFDVNDTSVTFGVGNTGDAKNGQVRVSDVKVYIEGSTPVTPEVVSVAVTPKTAELPLNGTLQMRADVVTKGTASKEVNWSSSDASKATVDANGLVTPHALGEVTITAKAKDNESILDTATITVVEEAQDVLETISASGYTTEVEIDTTYEFDGEVYGHYSLSGDVKLTSDWTVTTEIDTSSTGDKTGVITYSKDDVVKTCNFTVRVKAAEQRESLPYTGLISGGKLPDKWEGNGESFSGAYYALKGNGKYIQSTKLFNAKSSVKVEVLGVCNGTTSDSTVTVYGLNDSGEPIEGASASYTPDKGDATNKDKVDATATTKEVTISGTGITGVKIELTVKGHNYVIVSVKVSEAAAPEPAVTSVAVSPKTANLDLEETKSVTLAATVKTVGGAAETVTWSVEDANPAGCVTVNAETGVVTAVAVGNAKVVATSTVDNQKSDYCEVSVAAGHVDVTGVSLDKTTLTLDEGATATLVATVAPSDASVKTVSWESNDTSVATVANGVVTAVKKGTATITVTTTEGGKTASCVVTVNEKTGPQHAGTQADPFTVDDAKMIFDGLDSGEIEGPYYVTGVIAASPAPAVNSGRGQFYLEGTSTNLYVYNANNVGGSNNLTTADIPVGSTVVLVGGIKNFSGTFEMCYNKENPAIPCELISVTKPTVHVTGVSFDPEEITIGVDGNATLSPIVAPSNASDKSCTYEIVSGNDKVSLSGAKVTGLAEGDAVIKATTVDGGFEATITVHVDAKAPATVKYTLTLDATSLGLGTSYFNGEKTVKAIGAKGEELDVTLNLINVMKCNQSPNTGKLQFKKAADKGTIANITDLGTIESITYETSNLKTYYSKTAITSYMSSGTETNSGVGFFNISNSGSATYVQNIVIVFSL